MLGYSTNTKTNTTADELTSFSISHQGKSSVFTSTGNTPIEKFVLPDVFPDVNNYNYTYGYNLNVVSGTSTGSPEDSHLSSSVNREASTNFDGQYNSANIDRYGNSSTLNPLSVIHHSKSAMLKRYKTRRKTRPSKSLNSNFKLYQDVTCDDIYDTYSDLCDTDDQFKKEVLFSEAQRSLIEGNTQDQLGTEDIEEQQFRNVTNVEGQTKKNDSFKANEEILAGQNNKRPLNKKQPSYYRFSPGAEEKLWTLREGSRGHYFFFKKLTSSSFWRTNKPSNDCYVETPYQRHNKSGTVKTWLFGKREENYSSMLKELDINDVETRERLAMGEIKTRKLVMLEDKDDENE